MRHYDKAGRILVFYLTHMSFAQVQLYSALGDVAHYKREEAPRKRSAHIPPDVITLPLGQYYRVSTHSIIEGVTSCVL